MNSVDIKKANGKKTRFNFKYDNGLPYKPQIECDYTIKSYRDESGIIKLFKFCFIIDEENLRKFNNSHEDLTTHWFCNFLNNEYWFDFSNCYIVVKNKNSQILEFLKDGKIGIQIFNKDNNLICEY